MPIKCPYCKGTKINPNDGSQCICVTDFTVTESDSEYAERKKREEQELQKIRSQCKFCFGAGCHMCTEIIIF